MINILKHKAPFIKQGNNTECGAACLTMILHYYGNYIEMDKISEACGINRDGITIKTLKYVAENNGLNCKAYKVNHLNDLKHDIIFPIMMLIKENHFIVIENIVNDKYFIIDPNIGRKTLREDEIKQVFLGFIITLKPKNTFMTYRKKNKWNVLIEILKNQKSNLCCIMIISIIIRLCIIYIPFMARYLVDYIIVKQRVEMIDKVSILNLIIIFIYAIGLYYRNNRIIKLKYTLNNVIMKKYIYKVFYLPMKFFELKNTNELTNTLDKTKFITKTICKVFDSLIPNILMTILLGVFIFAISFKLSLIIIAILLIYYIVCFLYSIKFDINHENLIFKTNLFINESLRRINLIKCNGIEKNVVNSLDNIYNFELKQSYKKEQVNIFNSNLLSCRNLITSIIIICVGANEIAQSYLSIENFLIFISFTILFVYMAEIIINSIYKGRKMMLVLNKFLELMNYVEDNDAHVNNKKRIEKIETVEFNHVSFSYNKLDNLILKDVTFKINKGERVVIAGSSGVGKTTLIKLVLGLYKPYSGKIKINGIDLNNINLEFLRRNLGIVTQESYFYNDTIRNNIDISCSMQLEDIREAAKIACVDDEFMNFPLKYNTYIGHEGRNISDGEKRRIAVARALINKPSIVIFDEGITELDAILQKQIREKLDELNITQIYIKKEIISFQNIDKVFLIRDGIMIQNV